MVDTTLAATAGIMTAASAAAAAEVPPIPAHVHSGVAVNNQAVGQGKTEAYFFPAQLPDTAPAREVTSDERVVTRLGVRPDVTSDQFIQALHRFGLDDSMYALLNEFPLRPVRVEIRSRANMAPA